VRNGNRVCSPWSSGNINAHDQSGCAPLRATVWIGHQLGMTEFDRLDSAPKPMMLVGLTVKV